MNSPYQCLAFRFQFPFRSINFNEISQNFLAALHAGSYFSTRLETPFENHRRPPPTYTQIYIATDYAKQRAGKQIRREFEKNEMNESSIKSKYSESSFWVPDSILKATCKVSFESVLRH